MTRTFVHQFEPLDASPFAGDAELTIQEIESAGVKEIIQSAGAKVSSWSILEALLEPDEKRFIFREPLGLAREVKVAASGLFGRFVARAYLEHYMGVSFFTHLGTRAVRLNGTDLEIRRRPNSPGDLPDWVACDTSLNRLTIAEAKGCHDSSTTARMNTAWKQAGRVDVMANGRRLTVKRIAIVTRWASTVGGALTPIIRVRDPADPGDPETINQHDDAGIGLARLHVANLLEPLGFRSLTKVIRSMVDRRRPPPVGAARFTDARITEARALLEDIKPRRLSGRTQSPPGEGKELIGAYISRAGLLRTDELSDEAVNTLHGLGLRPMFVGIQRDMLGAIVSGNPAEIRERAGQEPVEYDHDVRVDPTRTWVVEIGKRVTVR